MENPEIKNARASRWMKRGLALLNENTSASLTTSLRCFERAIELRRALPLQENAWYRYVLAAGWMNRADALTRLGSAEQLLAAVRSYDEALALLRTLDLASHPLYRKRLALACMNRGLTLHTQATPQSLRAALASFDETIALLRDPRAHACPDRPSILASGLTNRAGALLSIVPAAPDLARAAAAAALLFIADLEKTELLAAEIGLKARHILCRAIAAQLAERSEPIAPDELIAAATDAADDSLQLARHWEARGEQRFRDLASELFRFGARAYGTHQTHFLTEFLLENLDPAHSPDAFPVNRPMHTAATEAIARAFAEIQRDSFSALHTPRFDRFLRTLRQLRRAETRLRQLRESEATGV